MHADDLLTLEEAMRAVIKKHGGVRATSWATGVDKGYIARLLSGKKKNPSATTLEALGLVPVPRYRIKASL